MEATVQASEPELKPGPRPGSKPERGGSGPSAVPTVPEPERKAYAAPRIAEASTNLVDHTRVIEVERIDPASLPARPVYQAAKRVFDVVACALALVLLALPIAVVALAIKLDSPGPVFFRQERLGKDGRPFMLVKFRSMRVDAEAQGAQWASPDDPRVTRVGHFLREKRLDEVPQFWNVLKGDMSLVGPRPERAVFYEEFETYIHGFSQRLMVRPGISGLAQVMGGYDLLPEEKIVFDLEYIKYRNMRMDLRIVLMTFRTVLTGKGAR